MGRNLDGKLFKNDRTAPAGFIISSTLLLVRASTSDVNPPVVKRSVTADPSY